MDVEVCARILCLFENDTNDSPTILLLLSVRIRDSTSDFRFLSLLWTFSRVSRCFICGHVRKPLTGGATSSKTLFGCNVPSTTALAVAFASSL